MERYLYSMRWKRLLVAAGCALAVAACGKEGGGGKVEGPVVAKVNDKSYTTADLEREMAQELRRAPQQMQAILASKEGQKQFLDRLVRRELLLQEAEKQKIGDRPEVTEQVAALRRELMIRALLQEEIGAKIKVEDKEIQEYFAAHAEEFSGDRVRAVISWSRPRKRPSRCRIAWPRTSPSRSWPWPCTRTRPRLARGETWITSAGSRWFRSSPRPPSP
jgi:hypothetical protein